MYYQSNLLIAPDIIAEIIDKNACNLMFDGCLLLTADRDHPYISVTDINNVGVSAFNYLVSGCRLINTLTINITNATVENTSEKFRGWLAGVASNGTLYIPSTSSWGTGYTTVGSNIPSSWTIVHI